jgi:hypothetical protein
MKPFNYTFSKFYILTEGSRLAVKSMGFAMFVVYYRSHIDFDILCNKRYNYGFRVKRLITESSKHSFAYLQATNQLQKPF